MNYPDHNHHAYEKFALQYHQKRSREGDSLWNRFLDRPMIQKLLSGTPTATKILDLGCGSGLLTRWLKDNGFDVRGVDVSNNLIAIAKAENPDIEFQVSDARATDHSTAFFDVVVSGLVLHYLEDLDPVLAEVSRVLKSNGVYVFTVHHPFDEVTEVQWNGSEYQAKMNPYFHNDRYTWNMLEGMELHSYHHTFQDISDSLHGHGFVIERILESRAEDDLRETFPHFHARTNTYPSFCGFRVRKI